jgi:hypothetical protein
MNGKIKRLLTSLSKTLDTIGKSEMGLKSETEVGRDTLGMGQTTALFKHEGK